MLSRKHHVVCLEQAGRDLTKLYAPVLFPNDSSCRTNNLGHGADQKEGGHYSGLKVTSVRRVQNPLLWYRYKSMLLSLQANREMIGAGSSEKLDPATSRYCNLGEEMKRRSKMLRPQVNEKYLFHGTSPEVAPLIFSSGFNERFANNGMCTLLTALAFLDFVTHAHAFTQIRVYACMWYASLRTLAATVRDQCLSSVQINSACARACAKEGSFLYMIFGLLSSSVSWMYVRLASILA